MSLTREQIRDAAMQLDAAAKESLAEELLLSVSGADRERIDAAWLAEAHRRDGEYAAGKMSATASDDVVRRLQRKAGQ